MIARYKNTFTMVLPGMFLAIGGLLWSAKDVSAGTEVTVAGQSAGGVYFYDQATELDIYRNRNLYFRYGSSSYNQPPPCHVSATLDGYNYTDGPSYEISSPVAPGVYNFYVTCSVYNVSGPGSVYWYAWIGYKDYQHTVYMYDAKTMPFLKIDYPQTIHGTITVSDVGQTRKLEKVAETDNQIYVTSRMLPKPLKVKVTGAGAIVKKDIPISFSVTPATANYSFSETASVKTITVNTLDDGTASVPFKLGTVSEKYSIKAVCDSCAEGKEVTFAATAKTVEQVTELQLKFCDYVGIVDQRLKNPIKVKAYNTLTGNGVSSFNVAFSVVDDPPSTLYILNPEATTTKSPYGIAKTIFTLGLSYGQYNVRAFCNNCQARKEVFCPITAGPAKYIQKEGTKVNPIPGVSVLFAPASFNVVYGKAIDICAIVNPPDKAGAISFESVKGGFSVAANPIPHTGCTSAGNISLKIRPILDRCILQDSLRALLDAVQPVAEAAGQVLIPTSEYAVKKIENSSNCGLMRLSPLCKYDAYNILFTPSMDVEGLQVKERLINRRVLRNLRFCTGSPAIEAQLPIDQLDGQFGAADMTGLNNQIAIPTNCGYQFEQRVYIEACPIQTNSITVEFDGTGNIITTRTDQR